MTENFLEKNLAQISRYNKKLAAEIAGHNEINSEFEFLESKCGDIILSYNGVLLHDDIDPQDEALGIFKKQISNNSKSSINILFGLGLGYLFKRFSMNCKGKIVVFEPNLDILRITLEAVDFSSELSSNSIAIINSKDDVQRCFERFYFGDAKVNLSFLKSYSQLYPELLQDFVNELGFVKGLYSCNYNNLFGRCFDWTYCGIGNIDKTLEHNELESLRGKFKDKPAVIISAGPSLTKNIDLLKKYKNKAVVFCVGTALKTAVKHGIEPDFLVVVEAEDCSFQTVDTDVSNMNVILQPMTFRDFHNLSAKRHFNYYPNNDFTSRWLSQFLDISLDDYKNRGTVSLCALFSAVIMDCNPIILVGQDLAYTDGKCYSSGSQFENMRCVWNKETKKHEIQLINDNPVRLLDPLNKYPAELTLEIAQKRFDDITKNLYSVKGQNGEMLFTEPGYATFIRYFENTASEYGSKIKLVNATEGGAYIEGFEHISLKSALENHAKEFFDVEAIIQESLKSGRNLLEKKGKIILDEIDKTIKLIEESLYYFKQGGIAIEKTHKEIYSDSFKNHYRELLENFLYIEQMILNKNSLILGIIYSEYSRFSHYIQTSDDILDINSIEKFLSLAEEFFLNGDYHLTTAMKSARKMRERLAEAARLNRLNLYDKS